MAVGEDVGVDFDRLTDRSFYWKSTGVDRRADVLDDDAEARGDWYLRRAPGEFASSDIGARKPGPCEIRPSKLGPHGTVG